MTGGNQRWRDGRDRYRPAGEVIDPRAYEVAIIPDDTTPKAFVERHHYSGSFPAARFRVGLYNVRGDVRVADVLRDAEIELRAEAVRRLRAELDKRLVGVAVFSHPPSEAVLERLPCERLAGVELGRFVLLDSVPGNGESWFLARCFELLRANGFEALVSHSDPVPRFTLDGGLVMPGHVGSIYQATNAVYAGRTKPYLHAMMPDGTVFSPRSMTKIRLAERGHLRCVDELVGYGAPPPSSADLATRDGRRDWMWGAIAVVGRRVRHAGNHRYLWAIDKRLRRAVAALACGAPYPKAIDAAA